MDLVSMRRTSVIHDACSFIFIIDKSILVHLNGFSDHQIDCLKVKMNLLIFPVTRSFYLLS